jgi:hypothetical protein
MRGLSLSSKKGQVSSMAPAILALVFAGIILVFGIIISQELRDTQDGSEVVAVTTNETLTLAGTGITSEITASNLCGYTGWTPTKVMNCTAPTCATASNQTLALTTDYKVNANGSLMNVTHAVGGIKVTYTYTYGGAACNTANKTMIGLASFADFWEIIVLAIVITIVIGLLLVVFGGKNRR